MSNAPTTPAKRSAREADPADKLPERFEPRREIARGGMGAVVEAFDRRLGRTVAVKQSLSDDADTRMRFEREIAITARLEHPSIVPVYDAGEAPNGEPFYVMRRVTGAPLDELVERATTLDARLLLLPNVLAVADAIAHAHRRGVIHRDLKPTNVLVGELGETVVIDWGLAKLLDEDEPALPAATVPDSARRELATTIGAVIGTPGFMPPEQVLARPVDARADVFALGATLFFVLAGRTPFTGDDAQIFDATLAGRVPSLPAIVPGVPPELVTIVETAMARDADKRYADAGGLGEDLRRFLGGQLVAAHRYNARQRLARWVKRHRGVVIASFLGVAIAVTIATIAIVRVFDAQARTEAALANERTALANERARADELVAAEASAYLESDPTRAVATLLRLPPDSPRWGALGPLVADARVRGIAAALPDSQGAFLLNFAPDGSSRLLTDGPAVRMHDLEKRTTTVLFDGAGGKTRANWIGGSLVLVTTNASIALVLDPATGAREPVSGHMFATAPGRLAFLDETGNVFTRDVERLPLANPIVAIPTRQPAMMLDLSPSGRYLAAWGQRHLDLFRRDGDRWSLVMHDETLSGDLDAFDVAEKRFLAGSLTKEVVEIDLVAGVARTRWPSPLPPNGVVLGEHFGYVLGFGNNGLGVDRLDPDGKRVHLIDVSSYRGPTLARMRNDIAVLATPRRITIGAPLTHATLRSPLDVTRIATDPSGRWLAGITQDSVLVWDLAAIIPASATTRLTGHLSILGPTTFLAAAISGNGYDLFLHGIATPFAIDAGISNGSVHYGIEPILPRGPALVVKRDDGIAATDPKSGESWMIARGLLPDAIAVSPDGSFALAATRAADQKSLIHYLPIAPPTVTPALIRALTIAHPPQRARDAMTWDVAPAR